MGPPDDGEKTMAASVSFAPAGIVINAAPTRANDNAPASGCYYPEMGETAPTRLFVASMGYQSYTLKWEISDNAQALEAFRRLRVRPSGVGPFVAAYGPHAGRERMSASITFAAHRKLMAAGLVATECLLD